MIVTKDMISAPAHDQKDLWETPDHIFDKLDKEFRFTLDPCCLVESAKCKKFFTPKEDGLIQSWGNNRVFVNPPYSRGNIDKWVDKCYYEFNCLVVALLPVSTSSDWYQNYICGRHEVRFVNKRIRFKNAPYTAPFSSMIVVFNRNPVHKSFNQ